MAPSPELDLRRQQARVARPEPCPWVGREQWELRPGDAAPVLRCVFVPVVSPSNSPPSSPVSPGPPPSAAIPPLTTGLDGLRVALLLRTCHHPPFWPLPPAGAVGVLLVAVSVCSCVVFVFLVALNFSLSIVNYFMCTSKFISPNGLLGLSK